MRQLTVHWHSSRVNGIDTEEIKTKIVEDEIAVSDEPLHAENSQDSEVVLDETRTAEFNEVCIWYLVKKWLRWIKGCLSRVA